MTHTPITGRRVLVAEDEPLISMLLTDHLEYAGYTVVGPFAGLDEASAAAQDGMLDVALLDINLKGQIVLPLAEQLTARSVPVVLMSGYGDQRQMSGRQTWPIIPKPFDLTTLLATLEKVVTPA